MKNVLLTNYVYISIILFCLRIWQYDVTSPSGMYCTFCYPTHFLSYFTFDCISHFSGTASSGDCIITRKSRLYDRNISSTDIQVIKLGNFWWHCLIKTDMALERQSTLLIIATNVHLVTSSSNNQACITRSSNTAGE